MLTAGVAAMRASHLLPLSRTAQRFSRSRSLSVKPMLNSAPPPPPPPLQQPRMPASQRGPFSWGALSLFLASGTAALAYYTVEKQRRVREITATKSIGKAAIGGPLTLVRADGSPFTERDLLGRWTLVYFGFTMCPDICPDELTKIAEALDIIQSHGRNVSADPATADISPILISIDPERDTPARTQDYATGFHKAFVGVSGTLEQVKAAAKAYRVYYSKDETPGDDYLVDHSIITYLMKDGEFVDFYAKNVTSTEMAARIEARMLATNV
jgi:protein SCO1